MTDKDLGFGIIGCGTIAKVHAAALGDLEGARVVAVSSRRAEAAEALARDCGARPLTDHRALLDDPAVDVVSITTSSGSHADLTIQALQAGKHVVVEKPMAMNSNDARRMIEAARAADRALGVIFQRRFEPAHQAVKRAMEAGALGRILLAEVACPFYRSQEYYDSADWRGTLAEDGGALMNQSIHSVDLLLWLCGDADTVFARTATQTHRMEAEDLALAILNLQSGAFAQVMASTSIRPGFNPTLNIYGERGTIKLSGADIEHWSVPGISAPEATGKAAVAVATNLLSSHAHHQAQFAEIVGALRAGNSPAGNTPAGNSIDGTRGFASVATVEAVYRSAREGAVVPVARL